VVNRQSYGSGLTALAKGMGVIDARHRVAPAFRRTHPAGPRPPPRHPLKHAIAWLAKEIPQSEHTMKAVQTAAHCVTEAAENGGPMQFARIGMMQAINRHKPVEFDAKRKSPHWGKRKLARDR
jgi:hypothetical protein